MDWLKNLKVGDLVVVRKEFGYGSDLLCRISGETPQRWRASHYEFRKSDGKLLGRYGSIEQATPENVAEFRTAEKRHELRRLFLKGVDKLSESDIDAITAIIKGRMG
ncbi:MAG: hypothetical protein AB7F32_05010 [Victivallaceae bacterium]